jgi:hypothetical protein
MSSKPGALATDPPSRMPGGFPIGSEAWGLARDLGYVGAGEAR